MSHETGCRTRAVRFILSVALCQGISCGAALLAATQGAGRAGIYLAGGRPKSRRQADDGLGAIGEDVDIRLQLGKEHHDVHRQP